MLMLLKNKNVGFLSVLCLSVCIMLSACSGDDKANKKEMSGSADTPEISSPAPDNTDTKPVEQPVGSDSTMEINIGDGKSVSARLPDNYPSDVLPLYKESFIVSAIELSGGFTITAFSKDDYTEIAAFYKEHLNDAEVTAETDSERGFTSFGEIGGYTYSFDVGVSDEMEGYVSSVVIMLTPAQ